MLRLAGLPPLAVAPRVQVVVGDGRLVLRFLRVEGAVTRFDLPLYALGDDVDAEEAQLRVLAALAERGYEAEPGEDGASGDGS